MQVHDRKKSTLETDVLSPIPTAENRPKDRHITTQDKVAARRAVLERKAAEKKALKEAEATRQQQVASQQPNLQESPATKEKRTKTVEVPEKELKKLQKGADKAEKAARKQQAKTAQAAESRARGSQANQEITVLLDASFCKSKAKGSILEAFESQDVTFGHKVEEGKLPGWSTIAWERSNSSTV